MEKRMLGNPRLLWGGELEVASPRRHLSYDQEDDKRLRRAIGKAFLSEAIARTEALRRETDTSQDLKAGQGDANREWLKQGRLGNARPQTW